MCSESHYRFNSCCKAGDQVCNNLQPTGVKKPTTLVCPHTAQSTSHFICPKCETDTVDQGVYFTLCRVIGLQDYDKSPIAQNQSSISLQIKGIKLATTRNLFAIRQC